MTALRPFLFLAGVTNRFNSKIGFETTVFLGSERHLKLDILALTLLAS